MAGMSGPSPLSQSEIRAWQENSGVDLLPWEVTLLRRLSTEYINQLHLAEDTNCKPPFGKLYRAPVARLSKAIDDALG